MRLYNWCNKLLTTKIVCAATLPILEQIGNLAGFKNLASYQWTSTDQQQIKLKWRPGPICWVQRRRIDLLLWWSSPPESAGTRSRMRGRLRLWDAEPAASMAGVAGDEQGSGNVAGLTGVGQGFGLFTPQSCFHGLLSLDSKLSTPKFRVRKIP